MKQKDIFLEFEGNAWFERNANALGSRKLPESDSLLIEILNLPLLAEGTKILEIGCGDGTRLGWLRENCGFDCYGVEPSGQAVGAAKRRGITAYEGTADQLPFDANTFDIVVFGFCLYLCDREDLFRIAYEADRVLRNPGWLLILDFYSPSPVATSNSPTCGRVKFLHPRRRDERTLVGYEVLGKHVLPVADSSP